MKNIGELLRDADPLRHESMSSPAQRDFRRQAILAAASDTNAPAAVRLRFRLAVLATAILLVIAALLFGSRMSSLFVIDLQAAVRFEVKLAEDRPAPGLREAKVSGSDRSVYLHEQVIVTNSDIAHARVFQDGARYSISVEFNASGTQKMRAATRNHIGKPVAILLDGEVVLAPVLRAPISTSAVINGDYTRTQAERIVNGIAIR